ncbi:spermidine/putrescine transport system permease protein [Breznakia sp. PF5-3]|uniref:extracellular solute-binding protein n=1 Tax=unclassified Breznakia TaxID=2623764 RepID=UPI002405D24B|nr:MULTISPECIES: extracellular solute-binding protein [unclassified Breznakia]MDF9825825.1 spermidine/putrescine transport system permease protein [Breznakia sp. PM6-1]MDF9836629.1 spermidine/putrescine transport system permease protein [Breznakia sp. PF5-3]
MKKRIGSKIFLGGMLVFFYLPIIYMMFFSFNSSKSLSKFTGFSLRWYEQMFANKTMLESIYYTLLIAIIATVVSTIVGTLASIGLSRSKKILREIVIQINNLPIMNPEIVTAIGLMLFFTSLHIEKGFFTLLLSHIIFCIPYVMLSVMPRIRRLDPNLAEAAMDLGATPFYALRKVVIPQLMPGIVAGALIAFTMSFDDFIISYFVTGKGVNNISIMVYTMSKRVNPTINSLSTIIVLFITVALVVVNLVSMRKKRYTNRSYRHVFVISAIVLGLGIAGLNALRGNASSEIDPIKEYGCNTLNVFNWGEYVGEDTISGFEEKYNVTVNYSVFASNEEMYTKLLGGESYDVLIPSDYMIERMIQEDMLKKIDLKNITNYGGLSSEVLNLSYDPKNEYSIPYFWGSVGIIYNSETVKKEDVEKEGFNVLKNPKYKGRIYVYDSERDSFMMALKALGYSMNTTDEKEINEAYEWLKELKENNPVIVTDEVIDGMINGEKDIAVVYSGDAAYIHDENSKMQYFEPLEGTNLWSDGMVIPKNSTCPLLAEEYINYNLEESVAEGNSAYVGYTSSVEKVREKLANNEFKGNSAYIPRSGYEKDEIFNYNEKMKKVLAELWIKVKAK